MSIITKAISYYTGSKVQWRSETFSSTFASEMVNIIWATGQYKIWPNVVYRHCSVAKDDHRSQTMFGLVALNIALWTKVLICNIPEKLWNFIKKLIRFPHPYNLAFIIKLHAVLLFSNILCLQLYNLGILLPSFLVCLVYPFLQEHQQNPTTWKNTDAWDYIIVDIITLLSRHTCHRDRMKRGSRSWPYASNFIIPPTLAS